MRICSAVNSFEGIYKLFVYMKNNGLSDEEVTEVLTSGIPVSVPFDNNQMSYSENFDFISYLINLEFYFKEESFTLQKVNIRETV